MSCYNYDSISMDQDSGNFEDLNSCPNYEDKFDFPKNNDEEVSPTDFFLDKIFEKYGSENSLANMLSEDRCCILKPCNEGTLEDAVEKYSKTNSEINSTSTGTKTSNNTQKKSKDNAKIFSITKEKKEKTNETPEFLGKKRQSENHTKFAFDNLVRKIKSKLFGGILIILNKSLEKETKQISREEKKEKKGEVKTECFLKPDQKIILQTNVKENLELLDSKLRDVFSEKVSTKVMNYSKEFQLYYNKNFIEKIKNDEKRKKTNDILDMTFFQCMEHFRGTKKYEALNGLEKEYDNVIKEISVDPDYMESFIEQLKNFEVMYRNKKPRNSKKKKISKL